MANVNDYRTDVRTDLQQLLDLVGLLVWSDDDSGRCGIRYTSDETKRVLEGSGVFPLSQYIRGAGLWCAGSSATQEHADAMDLPLVAFNVASGSSTSERLALGEIIINETRLDLVDRANTNPDAAFTAWTEQVRPLAMRLAAAFRHRYDVDAKPWTK